MTDRQKQSVRDMRQAGLSYRAIAASIGLSQNTVKSFCRRENIGIADELNNGNDDLCKFCGNRLVHHPGKKKKQFCSDKCRSSWWNRNRSWAQRKKAQFLRCLHCGVEFEGDGNKNRKYCGRVCYILSRYGKGLP